MTEDQGHPECFVPGCEEPRIVSTAGRYKGRIIRTCVGHQNDAAARAKASTAYRKLMGIKKPKKVGRPKGTTTSAPKEVVNGVQEKPEKTLELAFSVIIGAVKMRDGVIADLRKQVDILRHEQTDRVYNRMGAFLIRKGKSVLTEEEQDNLEETLAKLITQTPGDYRHREDGD